MASIEYLSAAAYKRFEEELSYLTKKKRKEISERLESARDLGDLSENAEYQEAKEEQLAVEARIAELEDILSRAVVIQQNSGSSTKVGLGCRVVLKRKDYEEIFEYHLVGSEEADTLNKKISNESPLGAALLGRANGETVEVLTPRGKIEYTIIEIS